MRSLAVSLALVALSGLGCKSDPVAPYRARGVATFDKLRALAQKPLPTLTSDTLKPPEPLKEVYDTGGNLAVYAQESLATPEVAFARGSAFDTEMSLRDPSQWLHGPVDKYTSPRAVTEGLETLMRLKYVFVVKTLDYRPPVIADKTYTMGVFAGEAHLFDLDGNYYGGVRVSANSSKTVDFHYNVDKKTGASWGNNEVANVDFDLKSHGWEALRVAAAKAAPGTYLRPH